MYRKEWRKYGWRNQFVTDLELLAREMAQEHKWEGLYGLTQFKVTELNFWEGEPPVGCLFGSYADLRPIREEDWLADDWEEFEYWKEESWESP